MAKKTEKKDTTEKNYYDLKTDAVDRLVNAKKGTSPEVSEEEITKYRGKRKFSIPNPIKAVFIKWWFNGAICFFFYLGLGTVIGNELDQIFVLAMAMGILTDLLTNHLLVFIEKFEHQNDKYMMVTARKFWSLFLNIPYAWVVMYCVFYIYTFINSMYVQSTGSSKLLLPVEPIAFGIFYMIIDFIFIGIKNTLIKIINDAKAKK